MVQDDQATHLRVLLTLTHEHVHVHVHATTCTRTHVRARIDLARLKVVVLIEYINLTTDVIDQKANSSSIIALEGKTIAK